MKHKAFIIIYFTLTSLIHGQKSFEIEYRNGWLYFDKYGSSSDKNEVNGYALQTEIILWMTKIIDRKLSYRLGAGYNNLWLLGVSRRPREISNYISLQGGIKYDFVPNKFGTFINVNCNTLLNGKPDYLLIYDERRVYANIDLGLQFKIGKRSSLSISSPLTILPLYSKENVSDFNPIPTPPYNIWVETTGLNLGIKWTLGKVD